MTERIAIVGMGGIFPDAGDLETFWANILAGRSAARPAPPGRWILTPEDALSAGIQPDRVYSHRACFIEGFSLDTSRLSLDDELAAWIPDLDLMHHLAIHAGHQAWNDARMAAVDPARVGVIIGNIALPTDSVSRHAQQVIGPVYAAAVAKVLGRRVDWAHTPVHALNRYVAGLPGGLIARTLGLGGGAHTLDAACAASLYALKYACDELLAGRADAMIAGGLSRPDSLYTQMGFTQLHALSASGICAPFSDRADGLVVGEGAGMVILKRLEDAIAHGDHIYAVIAGIGLSNDIAGNLMAPDAEGQGRAMRRAYELAGWEPSAVDCIECHGTGTPVGDAVEFTSLSRLWEGRPPRAGRCVIGSVKSNVGHLLTGAGAAGLIKTLLAMKEGKLPPTANFTRPNPRLDLAKSPFEVLTEPRDWEAPADRPRKAAVSAFGFGGINAHVLLEEFRERKLMSALPPQPVESDEPVAVVGMAAHFGPYGSLDDLQRLFLAGDRRPFQGLAGAWGLDLADGTGHAIQEIAVPLGRFRIPPAELKDMLPQQLLMLLAAADALKDAGIEKVDGPRLDMGVFIGIGLDMNTTNFHLRWELANQVKAWAAGMSHDAWLAKLREAMAPPLTANRTMGALGGIVASRVARAFKVGGPSFTLSSEQTSALHAIIQAATSLRRGEIHAAIVGGVEQGCDVRHVAGGAATPACDGAGALVLKRLADARADGDRVYALIEQVSRHGAPEAKDAFPVDAEAELGNAGPATPVAAVIKAALMLHHRFDPQTRTSRSGREGEPRRCLVTAVSVDGCAAGVVLSPADAAGPVAGEGAPPSAREPEAASKAIRIPATRGGFEIPAPPFALPSPAFDEPSAPEPSLLPMETQSHPFPLVPVNPDLPAPVAVANDPVSLMIAAQSARAAAQQAFLRVSQKLADSMALAIAMYQQALGSGTAPAPEGRAPAHPGAAPPVLDRDQCLEFAIGSIGKVLGERFAEVDTFPTRVRLPDEPLMLVDRIMAIEGEPCSMTSGRVVTEHDIHPGAWYLDGGVIPTCIAVEAGQADLFLSGYLGIDFITRGKAVYRLLDAEVTFHQPLPGPGRVIRYDIHIDGFFRQDNTYLFRFRFDGTIDGELFVTMHNGCAGFFSQAELDAGKGVVLTRLDKQPTPGKRVGGFEPFVPLTEEERYASDEIDALRRGDLAACFGEAFAGLGLQQAKGLPGGRMTLVHRILSLKPDGGRFGLGQIVGEADIHPDDWFLTCHFCDDQVMPGTLMYECCLHTLRVFLLRVGWVGEEAGFVYEPKPGVPGQLKCRGQVLATTKKVQYELTVKEIGYDEHQTPYVLADALMYADAKPIVQMKNMSLQLRGLTKAGLEARWGKARGNERPAGTVLFDNDSILAFAQGNPSEAFGEKYQVFDSQRKIARLPRPPYKFLDRIVHIENCEQWKLASGGIIEAEYDVPAGEWYFAQDRQPCMPFAVLLEVALQPCGWLAAYLGSALTSEDDLRFRNLGGDAVQLLPVTPDIGTLTTRIKITQVSQSGGMIIQHFDMRTYCGRGDVYQGTTYFGFFTHAALANQIGIRDAAVYAPNDRERARTEAFPYPAEPPFPDEMMRMIDRIVVFDPAGGPHGLGVVQGEMDVDPERWFFQAHFYQDPVCPGSLGLESFLQLLKVYAADRWGGAPDARFECMALGRRHQWIYRGQIIPADKRVTVQAVITAVDDATRTVTAEGFLIVDGRVIYQMKDFAIRLGSP